MHAKVDRLSIQVPVRQNLTAFINDLTNLQDDITLILDDYHLVDGVPEIREFMKGLVARAPVGLTLIIAGRRTPSVPAWPHRPRRTPVRRGGSCAARVASRPWDRAQDAGATSN